MIQVSLSVIIYFAAVCIPLKSSYGQSLARKKEVALSPLPQQNEWDRLGAVDGKYDRDAAACRCCADSGRGVDPWIEIDLGEANSFTRICVYGRKDIDHSHNTIDRLEIELDNVPVSVSPTTYSSDLYFLQFDFGQATSARKIKLISKGDDKRLVVCEFDVFNDYIISTRKSIEASSKFFDWRPSNAVDGLIRTNDPDVCLCCAATERMIDPWLKLDLGDTFFLTLIQLYGRTDHTYEGQSFEGLRINIDDNTLHTIPTTGTHIDYYEVFPTPDKIGRFIELTLIGSYKQIVMCEVVVYGANSHSLAPACSALVLFIEVIEETVWGKKAGYDLLKYSERVISVNKKAVQVTTFHNWKASRAVDGDLVTDDPPECECCSATNYGVDPWLEVDLGPNHKISRIVIYGRTDEEFYNQTFVDMNIQLDSNILHTIPEPDPVYWVNFYGFQLPSTQIGQIVKLTHVGPSEQLVVCELVVYGDCMNGYFGENCDQQCYCKGELCNNLTGICPSGLCEPGYEGETCSEQCDAYSYGQNCEETCGECRNGEVCNFISGLCNDCADGYTSIDTFCKTKCDAYSYGRNCEETCGECRNDEVCNFISGFCSDCADGYNLLDKSCKTSCCQGSYGYNCSYSCGQCRDNKPCNIVNGQCDVCADGYIFADSLCKTRCDDNSYGRNCEETCGKCRNGQVCNFISGFCNDCADGYTSADKFCKISCFPGSYGYNCSNRCGQCRDNKPCNILNGQCDMCADGYKFEDALCKTKCNNGTYGTNCVDRCGNCRNNKVCDKVDGRCIECEDGYTEADHTCKSKCPNGTYGQNCAQRCGACKDDAACHFTNGLCEDCLPGFYLTDKLCKTVCQNSTYGYNCTSSCGFCKDNSACNPIDGTCDRCEPGYTQTDCKSECQNGEFGANCEQKCGMCKDNYFCDKNTGVCPNGCLDGFQGDKCTQPTAQNSVSISVFAGSMAAVVVVFALCMTIFVLYIYRQSKQRKNPYQNEVTDPAQPRPSELSNYESLFMSSAGGDSNYVNIQSREAQT